MGVAALILGLSSAEMGCKQLVGIRETELGSLGGEGGAFDQGSGGVDAAVDGWGGRGATSTGGSGGASSHSGGNSGSGGASGTGGAGRSGTGGRPAGSGGDLGMGGSQAAGTATGGAGPGGSPASAADGGAPDAGTADAGTGGAPAKKPKGAACRMNSDCENDLCGAEWVCCNSNCNGQCESCVTASSPGTCVAVTTPRSPCAGSGTCAGACDGMVRSACVYPSSTTTCGEPSCTNGTARAAATCDGHGACVTPAVITCESGCSGSQCAPKCRHPGAANLLSNPGFDGSLSSWVASSASYSSSDADGCLTSGSAAVSASGRISQCLPATAGVTYWTGFRFKVSDPQQSHDSYLGKCGLDFFASPNQDCSGSPILGGDTWLLAPAAGSAWSPPNGGGGPAPAGTVRMSFYCSGEKGAGLFDQLYLGTAPAPNF